MSKVLVYGASDDLIEIEGDLSEEFNPSGNNEMCYLAFSDGTVLSVAYDRSGVWRINRVQAGTSAYEKREGTGPDEDYSDHVTLHGDDLRWATLGSCLVTQKAVSR